MRWQARVLVVAVGLIAAAPAAAQSSTGSFSVGIPISGVAPISQSAVNVSTVGELEIDFHGDQHSGCAANGLCSYSGTLIVRLGSGELLVEKYRHGHNLSYTGVLSLGLFDGVTVARVDRGNGAGLCADEEPIGLSSTLISSTLNIHAGELRLSLLQPDGSLLATRCAGPLDADIAGVAPHLSVPLRSVLRGQTTLSLARHASFAAHGLAGTVTSTIGMHLGGVQNVSSSSSSTSFPPGIKTERVRMVVQELSAVAARGTLTALISGTSDATECELLDSCGISGTLTLAPRFAAMSGTLLAQGPAKRPYRDFLTALGVARDGNPHGIRVFGDVGWSPGGTATVDLTQPRFCTDSALLGGGQVVLAPRGARLAATYTSALPPRTRCPGPMIAEGQTLASGGASLSVFRHRTFTLTLLGGPAFQDDGYTATTRGQLSLTLRRGQISQQVATQPTF